MKSSLTFGTGLFFALLLLGHWTLIGCLNSKSLGSRNRLVHVVCTTGLVADMVRSIGGDNVRVDVLIAPGVDPHTYVPSDADLTLLSRADLVVYNGLHLESKLHDLLGHMGAKSVAVTMAIPRGKLIYPPEFEGVPDPHVWFDATLWAMGCPVVVAELGRLAPKYKAKFVDRAARYQADILAIHQEVSRALLGVPLSERVIFTSHDACRYFAQAYRFEVQVVAGRAQKGLLLDDVGASDGTYVGMMRHNVGVILSKGDTL